MSEFREAYAHAGLSLVDGTAVLWALALCAKHVPEKLSGSDLVPALSSFAAARGYSVFFLGAAEGVAAKAADVLKAQYPLLKAAGTFSPPFGFFQDPEENAYTLRVLQEAKPDICFVALASPYQEIWMYRNYLNSGAKVMIGVGAGLDFIAGVQKRAPRWVQRIGAEWLWRLAHEPKRLWKRYLVDDMRFIPILLRECWKQRVERLFDRVSTQKESK